MKIKYSIELCVPCLREKISLLSFEYRETGEYYLDLPN